GLVQRLHAWAGKPGARLVASLRECGGALLQRGRRRQSSPGYKTRLYDAGGGSGPATGARRAEVVPKARLGEPAPQPAESLPNPGSRLVRTAGQPETHHGLCNARGVKKKRLKV